ncbi:hypothetical protein AWC01_09835 [Mycobacterium doricum]|nr:hypothetical protein AWC01_09835 [Mycolicibacterium doricum]
MGATMNAVRHLVQDRIALLGLLTHAGTTAAAGIGLLMVVTSLLPALTAIAVSEVVRHVIEASTAHGRTTALVMPIVVVGSLLACEHVAQSLLVPLREWVATRVNGGVRQMVRRSLSVPVGIDHLQDQVIRDAAALPVEEQSLFNVGAGADGQLWLMSRFVGAFGAAAVVAHYSLLSAVIALSGVVWQRSLVRRHYVTGFSDTATNTTGAVRAKRYWSEVVGSPLGAKELRVFGANEWAVKQFARFGREVFRGQQRVIFGAFPLYWKAFLLLTMACGVPFLLLARAGISGALSVADLTAGLGGVVATAGVLGGLGWECYAIEAAVPQLAALRRLRRLEEERTQQRRSCVSLAQSITVRDPAIRFERVSFRYPGTSRDVLTGLDLDLHPGQVVAVVGENGSGKSTLLKLLAGFYTPSAGRILINGHDLRDVDPGAWRNQIAIVLQDFVQFELTALENVTLSEASRPFNADHARAAAEQAGARELIEALPDTWNTMLSRQFRHGIELSGGQWQRISLARAFYARRRGRRVLIMDEPTSSLDVTAEVGLIEHLTCGPDGFTVVASHRFSTVRHAHRIVVLDRGRVIEDGDHATLHALGGSYTRLYDLQANNFQERPSEDGSS